MEAIRGLWNGGIGLATSLGGLGAVSAAFAGSRYRQYGEAENGGRLSLDYSTAYKNVSFYANYSQSFGQYNTIGLVVDREQGDKAPLSARANSVLSIGVAFPLVFDPSYLNINYSRVRGETQADNASLFNLGWSRTIFDRISLYVSGYADLKKHHNFGVFAGVSIPMGKSNMNASVNALPLGSEVIQDDSQKTSVMGYDGRVWLTDLSSQNSLTITMPDGLGSCHANFSYQEKSGGLPEIDGVTCL